MTYDSQEEEYFHWYLLELEEAGIISKISYHPKPFLLATKKSLVYTEQLKTKTKTKEIVLFQEHVYQADFMFYWNKEAHGKIYIHHNDDLQESFKNYPFIANISNSGASFSIVDVKGTFNQNDAHRRFSIDQKWVFQQFGVYVQKIISHPQIKKNGKLNPASALFPNTFLPGRFTVTNVSLKARKIGYPYCCLLYTSDAADE